MGGNTNKINKSNWISPEKKSPMKQYEINTLTISHLILTQVRDYSEWKSPISPMQYDLGIWRVYAEVNTLQSNKQGNIK